MHHHKKNLALKAYPWLVISCCAAFLIYKYILQVSPSVMTNELMQAFHVSGVGLGNIAATYFYSYFVVQLFAGLVIDKLNVRVFTSLAILACALGAFGFSSSHYLISAELSRSLIGAGAAFATVSYMKITSIWFKPEQFAFVGGLLATAAMIGAIFGEAPLAWLVSIVGWRQSLFICGILGLIIAALFFILVKNRPPQENFAATQTFIHWKDYLVVVKNKKNWLLTFYSGLTFTPIAVFGGLWGNSFLQIAHQLTPIQSSTLVSFAFFGLAIGAPALGYLSDRMGNRYFMMQFGAWGSLFSLLCIIYLPIYSYTLFAVILFIFGFTTGAFMLAFAYGKDINPIMLTATIASLINTGDAIFGSFTEPLTGKLLDLSSQGKITDAAQAFSVSDYHFALALLPLYLCFSIVVLFFLKKKSDDDGVRNIK